MVANNKEDGGDSLKWCIEDNFGQLVDYAQTWSRTPQGEAYWSGIQDDWGNYH